MGFSIHGQQESLNFQQNVFNISQTSLKGYKTTIPAYQNATLASPTAKPGLPLSTIDRGSRPPKQRLKRTSQFVKVISQVQLYPLWIKLSISRRSVPNGSESAQETGSPCLSYSVWIKTELAV